VVHLDDLVEARLEQIILSAVSPLLPKHRDISDSNPAGDMESRQFRQIKLQGTDIDIPKTGDIEYFQNPRNHSARTVSAFFTGD
jgi:hypothetical protein